jgi:peptidoglycan/xylan/chitin deacetylase (PgdA/CDA1 family)
MRFFRPGFVAYCLYPEALFRIETAKKNLYLTFDDGPDPESTPQLLDILKIHDIKANFFCTGKLAEKYPDLMNEIHSAGHIIGNHSYSHLNGWRTESVKYVNDVIRASDFTSDKIFRPPFGRLSLRQYQLLKKKFKIIFWDLMSFDYDAAFGSGKSLGIIKNKIRPGSIIVLHDSISTCANKIMPEYIEYIINSGYSFELLDKLG